MQRYLHWLAPLIAFGVAVYLTVFMIQVNRTEPGKVVRPVLMDSNQSGRTAEPEKGWLDALAKNEKQGYFYPVNEIYVDVDLNQELVNEKIYRLLAELHDPYQLFCLKQELKQHSLRYTLTQKKDGLELLVYSKNKHRLNALVKALKNYQITATYLPYLEDKRWKNIK